MAAPDEPPAAPPLSQPPPSSSSPAGSEPELVEKHQDEAPTASHALAEESITQAAPEDKGASQFEHQELEVKNLGWNDEASKVPQPVVGGITNEELWTLIRRFNHHIFNVRRIEQPPLGGLDMNIADDQDFYFSPEKLRAQLERFYISVVVSIFTAWKHVAQLRSWREWRRTSCFLGVYALAWLLDLVIPTITAFLMALILSSEFRKRCFPPAPPALIDSKTGGVQKPPAGVLASDDSVTGAPEKHQGEAVELEAHSFVDSISTVCSGLVVSTAAGKHAEADPHEDKVTPDPTKVTSDLTVARDHTAGHETSVEHDRTRQPVARAVSEKARPLLHMVADFVDTWERLGNALSATPPFPATRPRLVLAGVLLPVLIGSCFLTSYMMMKAAGFGAGFAFFGDPIITPTTALLNRTYPRWEKYVELRNTILRGVPTNAQLTVTLLRIGERNQAPIPPPPSSDVPPPVVPYENAGENIEHFDGATEEEIHEAIQPVPDTHGSDGAQEKPNKGHRIMKFFKGTTKGGIQTLLTADKAKAAAGGRHAKNRKGVVRSMNYKPETGPVSFPARFKGQKGFVYITATATSPALSWTADIEHMKPAWSVPIGQIEQLRKVGGLGWKSKLVVGWAMKREIMDGLVVKTRMGEEYHLTAISTRDELFNRLIAMGDQMWEAW
ncbi:hypothetical protein B0I35DRAFT_111005 [Stachybotrys elegans]|uniref:Transmembrane protein n=1 Tax=Stachybotrys elegans TaxID=80388 RepID=A0A8K0SGW5_9HYPO|nr:hypothetical protein B0I35DRAFT_111005 [Stachybotrys elegans]